MKIRTRCRTVCKDDAWWGCSRPVLSSRASLVVSTANLEPGNMLVVDGEGTCSKDESRVTYDIKPTTSFERVRFPVGIGRGGQC